MKLLLRKNVRKLGIVGDIVEVAAGYGRNYLLPQRLAVAPTETNKRALAKARVEAEAELAEQRADLVRKVEKLANFEVTIKARANEDGVLYGSVGAKEIAAALQEASHEVEAEQVLLPDPIRNLDNIMVDVRYDDDLTAVVKVWVVRERESDDGDDAEADRDGDTAGDSQN